MDYININQQLWDAKTDIHFKSDFYNVKEFLRGKNSLNSIELNLLGDISAKSILHLQCHFGMDSISLARLGAKVVGIDFSSKAIKRARELNTIAKTNVEFIQSDIYMLNQKLEKKFDIVFTSYGVVGWLPDMHKWAKIISHFMKPGGNFIMAEFHPVVWMFNDNFSKIEYFYFNNGPIEEISEGTYTNFNAPISNNSITWNHSLSEVIGSLLNSGLLLESFQEFDYSPYNCFSQTTKLANGKFQIKGLEKRIPVIYAIKAVKPE